MELYLRDRIVLCILTSYVLIEIGKLGHVSVTKIIGKYKYLQYQHNQYIPLA